MPLESCAHPRNLWYAPGMSYKSFDIDWSSKDMAQKMARRIEEFWRARGRTVRAEAILVLNKRGDQIRMNGPVWSVRTNMLNGFPNTDPSAPIYMGRNACVRRADIAPQPPQTAT